MLIDLFGRNTLNFIAMGSDLTTERQMKGPGIAIMAAILLVVGSMFIVAYGQIEQVLHLKNGAKIALDQALQDAANRKGDVLGVGSDAIIPEQASTVFEEDMNNWLKNAPVGVTWQIGTFQVYQDDMAGTPAPGDIPGDIPGASVYATVDITIPVLNIPLLNQDLGVGTVTVVVEGLSSGNGYAGKEHGWNGG